MRLAVPVEIPASRRVVEDIEVEGRAGTLTRYGGWEDNELSLDLALSMTEGMGGYRRAAHVISNAATVSLSGEPGVFRRVKHARVSELSREMAGWGFFTVVFALQPFTYLSSGLQPVVLTASNELTNPGLLPAAPVITVSGTGSLTLTINDTDYHLRSSASELTVDSDRLVTHVAGYTQIDGLTGSFPILQPGLNLITPGAGISRIVIVPNWRNP